MTDSTKMSADWIAKSMAKLPAVVLPDGNIRTGLARLSFPVLYEDQRRKCKLLPGQTEAKFSATFVFPPGANLTLLQGAATTAATEKWPDAAKRQLRSPFRKQDEKLQFEGYQEGGLFITCAGERAPLVVDQKGAIIANERDVYPGCWVLGIIRPFAYDQQVNKGVSFGLQGVIKIADDQELGGGGVDLAAAIGGIDIDQDVNPAGLFGGPGVSDAEKALM